MVIGSAGNLMFGTGKTDENDTCFDFTELFGILRYRRGRWRRHLWRIAHRPRLVLSDQNFLVYNSVRRSLWLRRCAYWRQNERKDC